MTQGKTVSRSLIGGVIQVLTRIAFAFEPLATAAITVLMNQQLNRYKENGKIGDYRTHTKRLGKYHYRIEIDLKLTCSQSKHLLTSIFSEQLSSYRRWLHE